MDAASREPLDGALPPGVRADTEAWFARMGVPQLIDDFTTERSMDARARILVLVWLIGGSFLWWGSKADADIWTHIWGGMAVIATMAAGLAALRQFRGKVMWWQDRDLDAIDTFALGPLIAGPSALLEGSWQAAIANGVNALIGMGAIYLIVGLGLGEIAWWGLKRLRDEFAQIFSLLGRTLPVLLILVLFLLFSAELWEAAQLLGMPELLFVIGLLGLIAVLLLLTTFRAEIRSFRTSAPDQLRQLAQSSPLGPLAERLPAPTIPKLRVLQRINLSAWVVLGQLIQSSFVAAVIAVFLMVFGLIVIPAGLQEEWIGEPVRTIASLDLFGETRQLTAQLVTTSFLLGSVVGLYFTGLSVTESAYRAAHFDRILDEAREVLAAHALYAGALRSRSPG